MELYWPYMLLLWLLLPVLVLLRIRGRRSATVRFSNIRAVQKCPVSLRVKLRPMLFVLRLLSLALLIFALARPREGLGISNISTEGVAIQLVVDRSGSMRERMPYQGRTATRLDVVKEVLAEFVAGGKTLQGRPADLIGLITFARYADTVCPLIHGHDILLDFIRQTGLVTQRSEDGTAIGDALALAAARLNRAEQDIQARRQRLTVEGWTQEELKQEDFTIKSKIIILLTDGRENAGEYSSGQAAELAKDWGIKIYAIGIGSPDQARSIFDMMRGPAIDENLLRNIAQTTGGFYARGDSGEQLVQIYKEIDKLEKTEIKSVQYTQYTEKFSDYALAALCLLGLEILAANTILRKIP